MGTDILKMNLDKFSIGTRLTAVAFFTTGLFVSVKAFDYYQTRKLVDQLSNVGTVQLPAVRAMGLADMMHDGIRGVVYRALLADVTQNAEELKAAEVEYAEFSKNILEYLGSIEGMQVSKEVKVQTQASLEEVKKYIGAGDTIIQKLKTEPGVETEALQAQFMSSFENLEESLEALGSKVESQVEVSVNTSASSALSLGLWAALLGCVLNLAFLFWICRSVVKTLAALNQKLIYSTESLEKFSSDLKASTETLSAATLRQSSALQETSSAADEIKSTSEKTADNAESLARNAHESSKIVAEGQKSVSRMIQEMSTIENANLDLRQGIEESSQQMSEVLRVISDIGQKTEVINDIVFQTKLLSFNASVEAARAGEHGKGFAVVAEEVGALAQMSGNAAKEITQMLDQGIRRVNEIVGSNQSKLATVFTRTQENIKTGRLVAHECDQSFSRIVDQVAHIDRLTKEISVSLQEQSKGMYEIQKALVSMNDSTQHTVQSSELSASLSRDLKGQCEALENVVEQIDALVQGGASGHARLSRESALEPRKSSLVEREAPQWDDYRRAS